LLRRAKALVLRSGRVKRLAVTVLFVLFCIVRQIARAEYQFTWEGNSNLFQGTFDVTDAEMAQAGKFYYSLSLTNSISISSPDGLVWQWASGDGFGVGGSALTNSFGIGLIANSPQGYQIEIIANRNSIQEWALPVGPSINLYSETGFWNITYVPEPSAAAVLALGAVAWLVKRKRLLSLFGHR
jgi:hypothetical protein